MRPDAHRHGCDLVERFARKLQTGSVAIRLARADDLATLVEARGLPALTHVDVPSNAPYYECLGFRYLATDDETRRLRAIRDHESDVCLDVWPRTSMRRELGA